MWSGCRTLHNTLVCCWYTCAATTGQQPTSGVVLYPPSLWKRSSGADGLGFLIAERRTSLTVTHDPLLHKPNPSCFVGVLTPPERSTHVLSRSRHLDPAGVYVFENFEDIMNGEVSEPLLTTPVVFPRPPGPHLTAPVVAWDYQRASQRSTPWRYSCSI